MLGMLTSTRYSQYRHVFLAPPVGLFCGVGQISASIILPSLIILSVPDFIVGSWFDPLDYCDWPLLLLMYPDALNWIVEL